MIHAFFVVSVVIHNLGIIQFLFESLKVCHGRL